MNKYYVTFGQVHAHRVNDYTFDKDSVAVIQAEDFADGRKIAFELFGDKWGFFYTEDDHEKDKDFMEYFPRGQHPANFKEVSDDLDK